MVLATSKSREFPLLETSIERGGRARKVFEPRFPPVAGTRPALMDRVEHDHRYLSLGLQLIVRIGGPKLERLFPQPGSLLVRRCPSPRPDLLGPDLKLDIRIGEDVAVPPGVFGRAAFRGDDEVAVAVRSVKQRKYELVAGLAAGGGQQQRRRRDLTLPLHVYLVHVSVGSAARDIALRVLDHPVR